MSLFPDIIIAHAISHPNKIALIVGGEQITWEVFSKTINLVANGLNDMDVGPDDMVAVLMDNSRAMVDVLFGIMKSGACSVPLNTSISDDAIEAMIKDCKPKVIIANGIHISRIDKIRNSLDFSYNPEFICSEADTKNWINFENWQIKQNPGRSEISIPKDAPCNVIYSSGTTGQPKGILHTHEGRLFWAQDIAPAFDYTAEAVSLCTIGLYSNIMWATMLCTFFLGGTLVVEKSFNAKSALKTIKDYKVTNTAMVPLQYELLLEEGATVKGLKSMKSAITVGSKMHRGLKLNMLKVMPKALYELYGLTEGIITVQTPAEGRLKPESVGKVLSGCVIRILDENNNFVAANNPGEIISQARFVMPGYLNRPEESKSTFWVDDNGEKWLRTGDVAYVDDDGDVFIVDRKKDMILSGGQNIYPQDIEAVLVSHPDISDVAVIGVKSKRWGETPIALCIADKDSNPDAIEVLNLCNQKLGKQQRITDLFFVGELPRNSNGKILKKELRKTYGAKVYD